MMEKFFIDTNIFIYAFAKGEEIKKRKAIELIRNEDIHLVTSIQVLNEFVNATVKKKLLSKEKAIETALLLEEDFDIIPLDRAVFLKGMKLFKDKNIHISFWDSLIAAGAILSECVIIYTEDMQHDFVVEGVVIKNPFLLAPGEDFLPVKNS